MRTGCRAGHQKAQGCDRDSGSAVLLSAVTVGIREEGETQLD